MFLEGCHPFANDHELPTFDADGSEILPELGTGRRLGIRSISHCRGEWPLGKLLERRQRSKEARLLLGFREGTDRTSINWGCRRGLVAVGLSIAVMLYRAFGPIGPVGSVGSIRGRGRTISPVVHAVAIEGAILLD